MRLRARAGRGSGARCWWLLTLAFATADYWDNTTTTGLHKAMCAIELMNALPDDANATWPPALGGGRVKTPVGVVVTGDLVDNGMTEYKQWLQFEQAFGLHGDGDGKLRYPVFEMRGNHDGGNTSDYERAPPAVEGGNFVARGVVSRSTGPNALSSRGPVPPDPSTFRFTGASRTGLHFSWDWRAPAAPGKPGLAAHFVALNLYAGDTCDGCAPFKCFYGPPCAASWEFPVRATLASLLPPPLRARAYDSRLTRSYPHLALP